jgi:hypothetical protein
MIFWRKIVILSISGEIISVCSVSEHFVYETRFKNFGVFRVKTHDFMPKNIFFSNFRGAPPPSLDPSLLLYGMAYQVIKQVLVWTKQETQLSYEIENRIIAGYITLVSTSKIINYFCPAILVQCSIIRKLNP